ncbi:hypothetical protein MN608_05546 [Microdochium nivale]|nr:hypothetical protein MN608_05546 [Microdochium nivale]
MHFATTALGLLAATLPLTAANPVPLDSRQNTAACPVWDPVNPELNLGASGNNFCCTYGWSAYNCCAINTPDPDFPDTLACDSPSFKDRNAFSILYLCQFDYCRQVCKDNKVPWIATDVPAPVCN